MMSSSYFVSLDTDPDQSTFLWDSWLDLHLILVHTIPLTVDHGGSVELERFLYGVIHKGQRNEYGYRIDGMAWGVSVDTRYIRDDFRINLLCTS